MCPILGCDRSYSHPSSMRKHLKTHGAAAKGVPLPQRILEGSTQLNQQSIQVKFRYFPSSFTISLRESKAWSTQHTSITSRWDLLTQAARCLHLRTTSRSTSIITHSPSSTPPPIPDLHPRQTSRWVPPLQDRPRTSTATGLPS